MKHGGERGFTLMEAVIAMALAATLLPFIGAFYFQAVSTTVQESANQAAFDDLRNTSVWLSYDLARGPAGNNLGLSSSRPPYASVAIGSSPGYSGNNALTIAYNVWAEPGSTTTIQYTVKYALEDLDPGDDPIQLVRTDETGKKRAVAHHIAQPDHVAFSGSSLSSQAGGVSEGLMLDMTSTIGAIRGTVSRSVPLEFTLPRTYQPPATPPPPAAATWQVNMPSYLGSKSGYWEVFNTRAAGGITANWKIVGSADLQLYVYAGQPFGVPSGGSTQTPSRLNAPVIISNSATTNDLTATIATPQEAGTYTVYFFNGSTQDYVITSSATVTYVSPGGELGE